MMNPNNQDCDAFVQSLRLALPYIVEYQNKVFIIVLNERILQADNTSKFIEDLLLLHRIGNNLIFIPDINQQTDQPINELQRDELIALDQQLWQRFQARWFKYNKKPDLLKSNFLQVRPYGVKNGKDYLYAAKVQGIFTHHLQSLLQQQWAIWLSPWGYSFSGIPYTFEALDIAIKATEILPCDKFLYLDNQGDGIDDHNVPQSSNNLSVAQAKKIQCKQLQHNKIIDMAVAVCQNGVQRFHFLNIQQEGALVCELFTRDGVGLLVYNDIYDEFMNADESCISDIAKLVSKLSENGSVLYRDKLFIEKHLADFYVMRRERKVIACVALHPIPSEHKNNGPETPVTDVAEIACLIVHPEYQSMGIASQLIQHVIRQAKKQHIQKIIALTVGAQGWFQRHGFKKINPEKLPKISNREHDSRRNSTIYYREI